jgi:hypothetical protein
MDTLKGGSKGKAAVKWDPAVFAAARVALGHTVLLAHPVLDAELSLGKQCLPVTCGSGPAAMAA